MIQTRPTFPHRWCALIWRWPPRHWRIWTEPCALPHFTSLHPLPNPLPFYSSPPLPALGYLFLFPTLLRVDKPYVLCSNRGNKDISILSLLAVSLQDTSDAMGVTEVRQSCSRLRESIRMRSETERKAGSDAGASIDGIIAAHGRLKSDFALARSWLTRYVETGNVPPNDGSTRGGATAAGGMAASAEPKSS